MQRFSGRKHDETECFRKSVQRFSGEKHDKTECFRKSVQRFSGEKHDKTECFRRNQKHSMSSRLGDRLEGTACGVMLGASRVDWGVAA